MSASMRPYTVASFTRRRIPVGCRYDQVIGCFGINSLTDKFAVQPATRVRLRRNRLAQAPYRSLQVVHFLQQQVDSTIRQSPAPRFVLCKVLVEIQRLHFRRGLWRVLKEA